MNPTDPLPRPRRLRPVVVAVAALLAGVGLVACGDSESSDGSSGSTTTAHDMSGKDMSGKDMSGKDMSGKDTSGKKDEAAAPSSTTTTAPLPAGVNRIDVAFVQGMIPHHAQAIEMSDLAPTNGASPAVAALAVKIKGEQQPEIDQMTGWLTAWGQPVPDTSLSMEDQMKSAGGMMMSGMVSTSDMQRLRAARGAEFDRLFLEFMILHHEGAIQMVDQQFDGGENPEVRQLAERIKAAQQPEIQKMNQLLAQAG